MCVRVIYKRLQRYKKASDLETHSVKSETTDRKNGRNSPFTLFCIRFSRFCKVDFAEFRTPSSTICFEGDLRSYGVKFFDEMGDFSRNSRRRNEKNAKIASECAKRHKEGRKGVSFHILTVLRSSLLLIPPPVLGTPYGLFIPLTRAGNSLWFIHTPHRFAELPYLRGAVCHPVCPQAESLPVENQAAGTPPLR